MRDAFSVLAKASSVVLENSESWGRSLFEKSSQVRMPFFQRFLSFLGPIPGRWMNVCSSTIADLRWKARGYGWQPRPRDYTQRWRLPTDCQNAPSFERGGPEIPWIPCADTGTDMRTWAANPLPSGTWGYQNGFLGSARW